ncbi:unnamed protein product, partial [Musa acuminata subsp. burmannicoides]
SIHDGTAPINVQQVGEYHGTKKRPVSLQRHQRWVAMTLKRVWRPRRKDEPSIHLMAAWLGIFRTWTSFPTRGTSSATSLLPFMNGWAVAVSPRSPSRSMLYVWGSSPRGKWTVEVEVEVAAGFVRRWRGSQHEGSAWTKEGGTGSTS